MGKSKFPLGEVVFTDIVVEKMSTDEIFEDFLCGCLKKFSSGKWGSVSKSQKIINDNSVKNGGTAILGVYNICQFDDDIAIITGAQRDKTVITFVGKYTNDRVRLEAKRDV